MIRIHNKEPKCDVLFQTKDYTSVQWVCLEPDELHHAFGSLQSVPTSSVKLGLLLHSIISRS